MATAERELVCVEVKVQPAVHVRVRRVEQYVKLQLDNQTTGQSVTGSIHVNYVRGLVAHGYRKQLDIELTVLLCALVATPSIWMRFHTT
jgi:hypothetical protein